jgi:hypothetical protein
MRARFSYRLLYFLAYQLTTWLSCHFMCSLCDCCSYFLFLACSFIVVMFCNLVWSVLWLMDCYCYDIHKYNIVLCSMNHISVA